MHLQLALLRPGVSLVVMIHIAEQQTLRRTVRDNADIHPHRQGPKVLVPAAIQFMKTQARTGRVDLGVKSSLLDLFLFISGQLA